MIDETKTEAKEGEVVLHDFNETPIPMRISDGYINGTAICKANNKRVGDYFAIQTTHAFLHALCDATGIPLTQLTLIKKGGDPLNQGTWVHPRVAINLGQWASPEFAVLVTEWVYDWMIAGIKSDTNISTSRNNTETVEHKMSDVIDVEGEVISPTILEMTDLYFSLLEAKDKRLSREEKRKLTHLREQVLDRCNELLGG